MRLVFLALILLAVWNGLAFSSNYYVSFRSGYSFPQTVKWDEERFLSADMKVKVGSGKSFSFAIGRKFELSRTRIKLEIEGSYGTCDVKKIKHMEFWSAMGSLPVKERIGPYDAKGKFKEYFGTLNAYWESKNWTRFFDMYLGFGIGFGRAYLNDFEIKGITTKARDFDGSVSIIHLDAGLIKAFKHVHFGVGYRFNYTGTVDLDTFKAKFPRHMVGTFLTIVF